MQHPAYEGLKAVVSMGLVVGGYDNSGFDMKPLSNPQRMLNLTSGVKRVHKLPGDPSGVTAGLTDPAKMSLTLEQAAWTLAKAAGVEAPAAAQAVKALQDKGMLRQATIDAIADKTKLTNGDTYLMIRDLVESLKK